MLYTITIHPTSLQPTIYVLLKGMSISKPQNLLNNTTTNNGDTNQLKYYMLYCSIHYLNVQSMLLLNNIHYRSQLVDLPTLIQTLSSSWSITCSTNKIHYFSAIHISIHKSIILGPYLLPFCLILDHVSSFVYRGLVAKHLVIIYIYTITSILIQLG